MTIILFFISWLVVFLSSLTKKPTTVISIGFALILAILFAFIPVATTPMDTEVYQRYFNNPTLVSPTFEPGYVAFQHFISSLGLDYWQFRFLIAVIGFSTYFILLHRMKVETNFFWALYPIVPFIEDTIQLRNYLMLAFMILAAAFLMPKRHLFWSLFFGVVGISFQSSGVFMFLGIFMYFIWPKEKLRNAILVVAGISFLLMTVPLINRGITHVFSMLDLTSVAGNLSEKSESYLTRGSLNKIVFADSLYGVLNMLIFFKLTTILKKETEMSDTNLLQLRVVGSFMSTAILILPFLPIAYNFDRITKNSFIFLFAFMAFVMMKLKKSTYKFYWGLLVLTFMYAGGYFVAYYLLASNNRYLLEVVPLFTQNTFWQYLQGMIQ